MMTVGEMRHAAVVEAQLRRIADALEAIARAMDGKGEVKNNNGNNNESEV